jgi:hypothetical protein
MTILVNLGQFGADLSVLGAEKSASERVIYQIKKKIK